MLQLQDMIFFKIALIILVSAPVIAVGFYLWFQIEESVRKKNKQELNKTPSRRRKKQ